MNAVHSICFVCFVGCFVCAMFATDRFERTFAIAMIFFGIFALLTK